MSRLMSVAMTTDAVLERRKTVTRRLNWWEDKNGRRMLRVGDRLTLCRKVQGRKPGEPIERLAEVEVVDVRRERLDDMYVLSYGRREVELEGFPGMDPGDFVRDYFLDAQGLYPHTEITRIEWRYLDAEQPGRRQVGWYCEHPLRSEDDRPHPGNTPSSWTSTALSHRDDKKCPRAVPVYIDQEVPA